ncbi:hypothetical protein VOLCADRAFT_120267 [Volvox carteri f. nagariensis]|uniref:Mediator of RNA polymerase II transcription subunit 10 n=1 Tax=Volvox carteri f. nagariensis TaxID=3068 RepID=D8TIV6_VOLCA|nr:uncharacterized protein VOLCADRAFT_120267 [Volvox carteri f. nagariensis]EFJ52433.1 hypothetical protein VOLCADRAFT_120267 [Volvox carteri f. nagariensis]|eukprot:XP_002946506.1 hypothetical protein VOLCADRAFT_120267 [Volvox carteri f. nagariensis]
MAGNGPPSAAGIASQLSRVLWKIHELEATLASYDASHAELLEQRLVQYEELLSETRDMLKRRGDAAPGEETQRNTLEGRKVPEELVRALDGGVNPDEYLRETFKLCRRDNQISKGKCEALQLLFANLLTDSAEVFPQEAAEYRRGRGGDVPLHLRLYLA